MNKMTHSNKYPMPLLEEIFNAFNGTRFSIGWTCNWLSLVIIEGR
jgi:hypothetical protein